MKVMKLKTKKLLLAGVTMLASAFFAVLFAVVPATVQTNAATIAATDFQTNGASVRVFKKEVDGSLTQTDYKGIRFHVEMGNGYAVNGTPLLDVNQTNELNGSYKMAEGYKTYTLILPKRLHSGKDITLETAKVMKIDTTKYWYSDTDGNLESVAYLHSIPENRYTDEFSFRGVICAVAEDGTESVVAYTDTDVRSLTYVAKRAYVDTIDEETNYWGSSELDTTAAPMIKAFIPTYNVNYTVSGSTTTEEVMWGDVPQNVPDSTFNVWFDETNSQEIDITKEMTYAQSGKINLVATKASDFILTGVVDYDGFEYNGANYNGAKVYATIHSDAFAAEKTPMDIKAVTVNYEGTGSFDGLQGVWAVKEGNQMRLVFAFDSSKMNSGDKLIIAGHSVFYANGVMYELTEDYTIDYTLVGNVEDYGINLGSIHNADIEKIENCAEDSTNDGVSAIDEWTIRVFFYEDVLIDDAFTFTHPTEENPVYIKCGQTGEITAVEGGVYYWLDGQYKILELMGENGSHKVFGEHGGDELFFKAGTILRQNGGYYTLEDEVHVRYNGYVWTIGNEMLKIKASDMDTKGEKVVEQSGLQEIRINTTAHWTEKLLEAEDRYRVSEWMAEKRDKNAPYAVYHTAVDGTISEIPQLVYHGQDKGNGTYFQIFGIRGFAGEEVGETVTIAAGTYLWIGGSYVAFEEEITYYFNGLYWVQNYDENSMGELNTASFEKRAHNQGDNEVRVYFTAPLAGYTTENEGASTALTLTEGSITINGNAITEIKYQRWDAGSTWFCLVGAGIGGNVFSDKIVIEAGTTVWGGSVAYTFMEKVEWLYVGNSFSDSNVQWVRTTVSNVTVNSSNLGGIYNDASNGGEIRLWMDANGQPWINDYQNKMAIDTTNPVLYNGQPVAAGWSYGSHSMVSVLGYQGANDGDWLRIPAGSVWYTPNNGSLTFADEIFATYVNGEWKKGDYRATVSVTANAATVSALNNVVKGNTYVFTVTPNSGYTVSKVTINGNVVSLNANNRYTFTAQAENTIIVETLLGYSVTFSIADGIVVDGGNITNGMIKTVENGGTLTFSVSARQGYRVGNVTGASKNADGTYTVSSTANTRVTITAVKQYKVNYSGVNATVTANVANGAWVDNGKTVTFTVTANSGYSIMTVNGATDNGNGTYTAKVSGADITVTATAIANSSFIDITDRLSIEDRAWGVTEDKHVGGSKEIYVALLDMGITNADGTHYFNTSVNDTWYVGNNAVIEANNGVDIMQYIYVNGQSARSLIEANANGARLSYTCNCWLSNPAAYPVYVETTGGSGLMIRLAKDVFGTEFTLTIKAGFMITNAQGQLVRVCEDVEFVYNGGAVGSKYNDLTISTENASVSGVTAGTIERGVSYTATFKANSGYQITSVIINGYVNAPMDSYTFTGDSDVSIQVIAKKSYTITWSNPTDATIAVAANGEQISSGAQLAEGTSFAVTVAASNGYRIDTLTIGSESVTEGLNKNYNANSTINRNISGDVHISATTVAGVQVNYPELVTISGYPSGSWVDGNITLPVSIPQDKTGYEYTTKFNGSSIDRNTAARFPLQQILSKGTNVLNITVETKTYCTITFKGNNGATAEDVKGATLVSNNNYKLYFGDTLTFTANDGDGINNVTASAGSVSRNGTSCTYTIPNGTTPGTTITITIDGKCLVEGTMIMMADGTQKAVENVVAGDKVMVFNHETGKYEVSTIWFNDHADDPAMLRAIINLEFANGATARIAYEHGYFDLDLMRYVFIRADNMHEFIGHRFVSATFNGTEVVNAETTLVKAYITEEVVKVYGPITEYHFNLVSDDMLSMPSFNFDANGMVNIFEYDEDLSYNEEKMQADIEAYGVFTYEEFSEYMSYEDYCKAPIQYFKVAIGKGNLTWEQIELTLQYLATNEFAD